MRNMQTLSHFHQCFTPNLTPTFADVCSHLQYQRLEHVIRWFRSRTSPSDDSAGLNLRGKSPRFVDCRRLRFF